MNNLEIGGAQIAYQIDGPEDGPTLVFINSLGTNMDLWSAQVAGIQSPLRVIRYDLAGHGHSTASSQPSTLAEQGRNLIGLLDHLGITRTHICGLSLGGIIGLWVAIHHPERVERAVFANTAARIGSAESWSARITAVQHGGMAAVRNIVMTRFLSEGFRLQHPRETGRISAMLDTTDPAGYVAACAALRDADLQSLVSTIRIPSLIIAGEYDQATPPEQSAALQARIVGSQLLVLPHTGHLSNVEQPAAFNAALLHFLTTPL